LFSSLGSWYKKQKLTNSRDETFVKSALRVIEYEVRQRLGDLGVDLPLLQRVLEAGWLAQESCTPDDPLGYPGIHRWGVMTRHLRQALRIRGWSSSDEGHLAVALAPDHAIAICVSTGDSATGQIGGSPSTKYPKGSATVTAVEVNRFQLDMFNSNAMANADESAGGPLTWILLSHMSGGVVSSELSLPSDLGLDGRVNAWSERILLPPLALGQVKTDVETEFTPEVDIDIKRRR
jgi:hypothetical protein